MRTLHVRAMLCGALLLATFAGGSGAGCSSSPCEDLCDCVEDRGGDRDSCRSRCESVEASASDPQSACLAELAANSVESCSGLCASFSSGPTSASGSGGQGSGSSGAGASSSSSGPMAIPGWECTGTDLACTCEWGDVSMDTLFGCGTTASHCCSTSTSLGPGELCECQEAYQWLCAADPSGFCYCEWAKPSEYTKTPLPPGACRQQTDYELCCKAESDCSCYDEQLWGEAICLPDEVNLASCDVDFLVPDPNACAGDLIHVDRCRPPGGF